MRTRRAGLVAGLALLAAACGVSEAVPQASGPSEDIAVHGDWTIDVYDPDGALDQHHVFSNALTTAGADTLAGILGDVIYPGTWAIEMFSQGEQPCVSSTGDPTACTIYQPYPWLVAGGEDSGRSLNLEVVVDGGQLVLSGSHVASADGEITDVTTRVLTCDQPLDAADCSNTLFGSAVFTWKELNGEDVVQVSEGQSIQVEVVISFTSG